jgi:hypothetical protein
MWLNDDDNCCIEIALHYWDADKRPCDFSLWFRTPRGVVFADFAIDHNIGDQQQGQQKQKQVAMRLIRISYDGYGCCNLDNYDGDGAAGRRCPDMSPADAAALNAAVDENRVDNNPHILHMARRYFTAHQSLLWDDALADHHLLLLDGRDIADDYDDQWAAA